MIGIVGLGYVGLPLVQAFMNAGFRTMGFDVDQSKVDKLLEGKSYIGHITGEWIADCIKDEQVHPHGRHVAVGRGGRHPDLRADAAE